MAKYGPIQYGVYGNKIDWGEAKFNIVAKDRESPTWTDMIGEYLLYYVAP